MIGGKISSTEDPEARTLWRVYQFILSLHLDNEETQTALTDNLGREAVNAEGEEEAHNDDCDPRQF